MEPFSLQGGMRMSQNFVTRKGQLSRHFISHLHSTISHVGPLVRPSACHAVKFVAIKLSKPHHLPYPPKQH